MSESKLPARFVDLPEHPAGRLLREVHDHAIPSDRARAVRASRAAVQQIGLRPRSAAPAAEASGGFLLRAATVGALALLFAIVGISTSRVNGPDNIAGFVPHPDPHWRESAPHFWVELKPLSRLSVSPAQVRARSAARFETPTPRKLILHRGTLTVIRPRDLPQSEIIVENARIQFVGGRLIVSQSADEAWVEVEQGRAIVHTAEQTHELKAGERWPPRAPAKRARAAVPKPITQTPTPAAPEVPDAPVPPTPPPQRTPFEDAHAALERGDRHAARLIYRAMSEQDVAQAETAFFLWAELEADAGDYAKALRLLGQQASRFPQGSLGPERALRRTRYLLALGRCGEAASVFHVAADRFHYPQTVVAGFEEKFSRPPCTR